MPEVTSVVETAAEVAAPVVATIDYKQVAVYAFATVGIAACGYIAYRAIKSRKTKKADEIIVNPEAVVEEPEAAK